ncbi:hypothetical protein [Streptomyces sp. NPDC001435]|uniref:hypothetical protein n=1 Tax=Streptomyces sp. NPDC001435 TaxID=3364576 RepID=UPI0036A2689B
MTIEAIQHLQDSGTASLVGAARAGYHTLPDGMADEYTAIEQLLNEHTDRWGRPDLNPAQLRQVTGRADRLMGSVMYGGAEQILTEHVQPALDALLDQVRADRATVGRYANEAAPSIAMLEESDRVREAIVRLHSLVPHYGALRGSWEILRKRSMRETRDPLGTRSPLGEVANMPDLFADWEPAAHGRAPWPWQGNVLHLKLGWLLDNDGRIWLPTANQQSEAYKRYHPEPKRVYAA